VSRLKTPPIREIDVTLKRERLNADPATALGETRHIATQVNGVAAFQDYLLDNISNTLGVATADAKVAKRLFIFLGVPGGLLAAMLAAYSGNVLAEAQRREQATLRIRGASRRHLLRMLALRTALLTAAGSTIGLVAGYLVAAIILGRQSLTRASTAGLVTSALIGAIGGYAATGLALYITGRRSIDREINEDRARLVVRPPLWRRARLDLVGMAVVVAGTVLALRWHAFDGASGSVYFGRSVRLNLALLVLPIAVWMTASLFGARIIGYALGRSRPASSPSMALVLRSLWRRSIGRRPWAITNGAVVTSLIVALATCLAAFTSSYDGAKRADARYANGADIRITPGPTAARTYAANDARVFETGGVARATPVIYGLKNVILRSARTSDPTNVAAVDPKTYMQVAPLSSDSGAAVRALEATPNDIVVSRDMAAFLKARPGDTLHVLLARATDQQVEIEMHIVGLYERLPGFPDGADAVMAIGQYTARVPTKAPDFFLADVGQTSDAALRRAVGALRNGPAARDQLRIDTRATALDRDQSSLAALNIAGLVNLDSTFALAMAGVAIAIFVFGLLLSRRREYVTLRAQGLQPRSIRLLIGAEAVTVAIGGTVAGLLVGAGMGFYFVAVLRPLFVLSPVYSVPLRILGPPVALVFVATVFSSVLGSRLVNSLQPTELLRDE
jgi:putative ABC transport system permease protein